MDSAKNLDAEEKLKELKLKLDQKYESQKIKAKEKKKIDEQNSNPNENSLNIFQEFKSKSANISSLIDSIIKAEKIPPNFEEVISQINGQYKALKEFIDSYAYCLNNHDLEHFTKSLDNLETDIQKAKDKVMPKKKFAFSKQVKAANVQKENIAKENTKINLNSEADLVISDKKNITLRQTEMNVNGKKQIICILQNNNQCNFFVTAYIRSLIIQGNKDSKIGIFCVEGGSMISNCSNCIFYVSSHQVRIHDCVNCKFVIFSWSSPIIENCKDLQFAELSLDNQEFKPYFQNLLINPTSNKWNDVQDFNWLKKEKSPNWNLFSLSPEEDVNNFIKQFQ